MIETGILNNGKYFVKKLLGQGGMARVWLADEIEMKRQVVIKEPLPGMSDEENRILQARFQREKATCAALVNADVPNIVKVLTIEPYESGSLLVMEYMSGGDLSQRIKEKPQGLPIEEVLRISKDVLQAMEAIHNHPQVIIHRDIKPSNILFNAKDEACLGDFGLASLSISSGQSLIFTSQGIPFTPYYRAPELSTIDEIASPHNDIFSFGCVLFEMLTGIKKRSKRPGTKPSEIRSEIPEWLDQLVLGCLEEDEWDRIENAREVLAVIIRQDVISTKNGSNANPKQFIDKNPSSNFKQQKKYKPALGVPFRDLVDTSNQREIEIELRGGVKMTFVRVPAGEFLMGAADDDEEANYDEKPQHRVCLAEYWFGKYPITNAQYRIYKPSHNILLGKENHPVVDVSWDDAQTFCLWMTRITGQSISLPTEAEWEKAARGIDGRKYPWGNQAPRTRFANYDDLIGESTPVNQYPAGVSPYGAMDMVGNTWEWCADWYDAEYFQNSPQKNPCGPESGKVRVYRGSAWEFRGRLLRASLRNGFYPSFMDHRMGFRCVCSL